jgi:uncharacterized protein YjbJ (UPF0337 family)
MNRDQIEGKIEEVKGEVKKRIGGATGDPKTQAEGWVDEKKGTVQKKIGDVEEDSAKRDDRTT